MHAHYHIRYSFSFLRLQMERALDREAAFVVAPTPVLESLVSIRFNSFGGEEEGSSMYFDL